MFASDVNFLKDLFSLHKAFFQQSKNKYKNRVLLVGIVIATGIYAYLFLAFIANFKQISLSLTKSSTHLFTLSILKSGGLILGSVFSAFLRTSLTNRLKLKFQEWLTNEMTASYINKDNYLKLLREKNIANPGQVIESEIDKIAYLSLNIFIDAIRNGINLTIFSIQLWQLSGTFSFVAFGTSVAIPGGLLWAALAISLISGFIIKKIGNALANARQKQAKLQAKYRQELNILQENGESIAQERGEKYFKTSLDSRFSKILKNYYRLTFTKTNVDAFREFNGYFSSIIPYLITAPLYFTGQIALPAMFQISTLLSQVQFTLTWFTHCFSDYSSLKSSFNRFKEVRDELTLSQTNPLSNIVIKKEDNEQLSVTHLNIAIPGGAYLLRDLNLTIRQGENTLIKGRSGLGKSTLFKIFSTCWPYGDGEAKIPKNSMTLPQSPTIPQATLKGILVYPKSIACYTDEQNKAIETKLKAILIAIGMEKYVNALNNKKMDWGRIFSGGEKQMISFARALLNKPKWLYLDESTAAMDEESEEKMYLLLKERLPDTTVVSIGHRSSVEQYHQRIVIITKNEKSKANLTNHYRFFAEQKNDAPRSHRSHSAPPRADTGVATCLNL